MNNNLNKNDNIFKMDELKNSLPKIDDPKIKFNTTYTHKIINFGFDNLPIHTTNHIFKDGRIFSHFSEHWLEKNYSLKHIPGCKNYDLVDKNDYNKKYEQKTFTKNGCKFMPSNMIGTGRKLNKDKFKEHASNMNYIIISNIYFPKIELKFVKGIDLIKKYPSGNIPVNNYFDFFK